MAHFEGVCNKNELTSPVTSDLSPSLPCLFSKVCLVMTVFMLKPVEARGKTKLARGPIQ